MADIKKLVPKILKWEGGFVNDPQDRGGATNRGITLTTYSDYCKKKGYPEPTIEQLKNMTNTQWLEIFKTMYWDRWRADEIKNQSIADFLVDWVWMSGEYGIKIPQRTLDVTIDGIVGSKTINSINNYNGQETLFNRLKSERVDFIERICRLHPTNSKFRKGWLNRINDLRFTF